MGSREMEEMSIPPPGMPRTIPDVDPDVSVLMSFFSMYC